MPVIFSQVNDDWDEHREGLLFVSLEDVKEIVIFEETHSSISDLEMDATNTFDDSLEQFWDQMLDVVNLAYL